MTRLAKIPNERALDLIWAPKGAPTKPMKKTATGIENLSNNSIASALYSESLFWLPFSAAMSSIVNISLGAFSRNAKDVMMSSKLTFRS